MKTYSVQEVISYAREHSPYYQALYQGIPQDAAVTDLPLLDADDFWAHCDRFGGTVATRPHTEGQVFKSGGTTCDPKYSLYTTEEWETLCTLSAAKMPRGGLKDGDRVANLYYAGGMYASFLFTNNLMTMGPNKALVYNLAGNVATTEEIVHTILDHKVNCIAGLPSMLTRIAAYIGEEKLTGFVVDTIYFAGETLYEDQRETLRKPFGQDISIRSVSYASNDGGAIGYFAEDCGFNEHRTMTELCYLELIDPDTGEVITEMNRPGHVYITSLFKTLTPLIRYPAGDVAEYTEPEGTEDRKFRLLGRSNVAARAGVVTLYPQDLAAILKECGIDYYAYQIIVDRAEKDYFTFRIAAMDPPADATDRFMEKLIEKRPLIQEAMDKGMLAPSNVEWVSPEELEYNPRTGKLKAVLDKRLK